MKVIVQAVTAIMLLAISGVAQASSVQLAWDPSPDSNVVGYRVYYSAPQQPANSAFIGTGATEGPAPVNAGNGTTAQISGLDSAYDYSFAVTAVDAAGNESAYSNVVTVAEMVAPTVAIATPAQNAALAAGTSYNVSLEAVDNKGVVKAELYLDGTLIGSSTSAPYQVNWSTNGVSGNHVLQAKAYDAAGNVGTSTAVNVTVVSDTVAPNIVITSPVTGATVSSAVAVSALASDNVAVSRVEFYVDNLLVAAVNGAAYGYNWDSTRYSDGTHVISAQAFDAAGNVAQSTSVGVMVKNVVGDTTAPVITSTPVINAGAAYTANATVKVTMGASDNSGTVTAMQLSADGTTWAAPIAYASSFSYNLSCADGNKKIYVRAIDASGNISSVATSASIVLDRTAPVGSVTINGGAVSTTNKKVILSLQVTDANPGVKMQLSTDGITWGKWTAFSGSYSYTFSGTGTKKMYVRFLDLAGNISPAAWDDIIVK